MIFFHLPITFCSYKKLAFFTTNVEAENQTLINHKCVCGALNRQILVGAVIASGSCRPTLLTFVCIEFEYHCLVGFVMRLAYD